MKKRIFSMLLVVCMVVSLLPANIFHVHADTVTKKPFYLVNGSAITGGNVTNSYSMPKTWTDDTTVAVGQWPRVYLLGQSDPAGCAQALADLFKDRPEGTRYFEFDMVPQIFDKLAEDRVYFDDAVVIVKEWLESFLAEYAKVGGVLDGIVVDLEYHDSHTNYLETFYNANNMIVADIVADEAYTALRERLLELGFDFTTANGVPEIASAFSWYTGATYKAANYRIWNQVMDEMERNAINTSVLEPLLKYFPDATVSDYQAAAQHSYNETLVWNGLPESYGNIHPAGNATNMNAYAGRLDGSHATPDGYILGADESEISATAFNSALFEVKFAKDAIAVSQDFYGIDKQHIWVGGYSYGRIEEYEDDGSAVNHENVYTGSYSETPYYTETMLHLGLATDEPFLGYIIESEEDAGTANNPGRLQFGGVGYQACIEIFDDILKELTRVAGTSDRKPIRTAANWNGSYILSGMYAGGRNIWRLTPDTSVISLDEFNKTTSGDPTFEVDGLTISFPGGRIIADGAIRGYEGEGENRVQITDNSCGYWIETSANVQPVIVGTAGRYTNKKLTSETANQYTFTGNETEPYENITMYNTVNGQVVATSNADTDYRIVWVNNTASDKKGVIKANDVEVATFNAPKGQDGVAVGTVDVSKLGISGNITLTVEYTAPDTTSTPDDAITEDFFENYIDDSHAVITVPGTNRSLVEIAFNEGEVAKYYTTSNGVAAAGTSSNYNIKVEYPQDGMATVYLKGATLTATGTENALKIGNDTYKNFDLKLVVEDDSTLTADAAAIEGMMNGSITVTGAGKLTVTSNNSYAVKTTYKLIFKNAEFAAESKANNADINDAAVWSQNADIVIDNSIVELAAAGGACLWNGAINGTNGDFDITIKNGSTVTANSQNNAWATIGCGGTITIDKSDVTINSEDASGAAGNPFASKLPVITNAHAHADGSEWDGKTFADISLFTTCSKTVVVPGTPATCTTAGTTDKISCESCGEVLSASETIAAKGHNFIIRTENYVPAAVDIEGSYDLVTICTDCDFESSRVATTIEALQEAQTANFSFYTFYNDAYYAAEGYKSTIKVAEGDDDRYYILQAASDAGADTNYVFNNTGANEYNYNLKLSWSAGGQPTLYLKNVNYTHQRNPLTINAGDVPVTIVVEGESTIFANYVNSTYNAIVNSGTAPLTITSRNNAKLTVIGEAAAAINSSAGVIFKDANVELRGNTLHGSSGTINTAGDVVIDRTKLHMTAEASAYIKGANNISIINGSKVTTQIFFYPNQITGSTSRNLTSAAFDYSGEFLISGSDVAFTRNNGTAYTTAGTRLFPAGMAPVLRGVIVEAGGWSGTFVSVDDTYNDYWENVKYYPGEYDAARLNSYNYFQTTACEHTGGEATCTERAVCTTCGMAYGPDPSHTYTVTDCTEDTSCTVCGEVAVAKVAAHTVVTDEAIAATCTVDGLTAGSHCSVCNKTIVAQLVVPATGHTEVRTEGKDATCYEDGYTSGISCSVCGEVIKPVEVLTAGHTVVIDPASDATCIAPGLSEGSHCSVCNYVIEAQEVTQFLPHVAGDPVQENVVAPTCTAEGSYDEVTYCKNGCHEEMSREKITVEKLPHKLTYSKQTIEDVEKNVFTCVDCGHVEDSMTYDYADYEVSSAYLQFYNANNVAEYNYYTTNAPVYYRTVDGRVSAQNADEYNYNIKAMFVDGKLKIYLRNAEIVEDRRRPVMVIGGGYTEEKGYIYDFPVDIIVESNSSLTVTGSTDGSTAASTIQNMATGLLTISSSNNAKLSLRSIEANGNTVTSTTFNSVGSVKLENTNVEISNVYQTQALYIGNSTTNSNLEVINSKLNVITNSSGAPNAIRLAGTSGNVTFTNSQVTVKMNKHSQYTPAIYMLGEFNINRSDLEINVNSDPFQMTPTIDAYTTAKYGQYSSNAANTAYTLEAGRVFNDVHTGFMGHFKATHTCLAGDVVHEAPKYPCDEYMQDVTYCVVCGVEMSRVEQGIPNENAVEHVAGEAYRDAETETNEYYEMVIDCSVCGIEMDRDRIEKPTPKTAYIKIRSTGVTVNTTDTAPKYYKVTDGTIVEQITDPALYNTYNIKVEYPLTDAEGNANSTVYIYLKDLTLDAVTALTSNSSDKNNTGLTIGSATYKDFACEIVVESASSITGYGGSSSTVGGAIYAVNTQGLTISSKNKALLTLKDKNGSTLVSNGCSLTFKNANVESLCMYYVNIRAVGDLLIENSNLTLNYAGSRSSVQQQILLSSSRTALDGSAYNITIKNSKVVSKAPQLASQQVWMFGGKLDIERSDVTIEANSKAFTSNPNLAEGTHSSVKVASYGYDATMGTMKDYTATPYESNTGIGYFNSAHECGGATEFEYELPEVACSEYYDVVYRCATCGEEYHREQSDAKLPADQIAAQHTPGEPEKIVTAEATAETDGSYYTVTKCTECDKVLEQTDPVTVYKTKSGEIYIRGTKVSLTNDGTEYYYTVSGTTVTQITDPALYNTYNVKVVYPNATDSGEVNNTVYVYLKALNLDSSASGNYGIRAGVTSTVRDFACHIIVESASTITGYNGAIYAYNNGGLTISSVNDALLTLDSSQNTGASIKTTQCDVTLLNANVVGLANYYSNLNIAGDLTIENSTLTLTHTKNTTYPICLSTKNSALDGTTNGNISIKNSKVTSGMIGTTYTAVWLFEGRLDIERSDVEIRSNAKAFSNNPYLVEGTHASVKVASYATASSTGSLSNYSATPGDATNGIGYFLSTHTCGGEPVLTEPAPEAVCVRYYLLVTNCATCGEHLSTVESDVVYNENPAPHVAGEPVKENVDTENNTYDMVTYCTTCGVEMDREPCANAADTVPITFGYPSTTVNLAKNDEFVYYTVDTTGAVTKLTEDTSGYNIKLVYRNAENKAYIYLNGVDLSSVTKSGTRGLVIGSSSVTAFACEIVVEKASTLRSYSSNMACIYAYNTEGLKITSVNKALLTLQPVNVDHCLYSASETTIENANVFFNGSPLYTQLIWIKNDLNIVNSGVEIYTGSNGYSTIVLSDSKTTVSGENRDLNITNSKITSTLPQSGSVQPILHGGVVNVNRSDVSFDANDKLFSTAPFVENCDSALWGRYAAGTNEYPGTFTPGGDGYGFAGFDTVHTCGGVETLVETVDHPCRKYNVYEITCAVYGCDKDFHDERIEELEAAESHNLVETGRVVSVEPTTTTTGEWLITYTCSNECGHTETATETIPVLSSTYFQYYSSAHSLVADDVIEGDTLYYVAETVTETHSKGNMDFTYLATTEDTENWNIKIEYVEGVPTMYLKELDLNNCVGLVFGGKISAVNSSVASTIGTTDLKIVVVENSTISKGNDSGGIWSNGNMWHQPSINLLTTGTTTITGEKGKILTLSSTNNTGLMGILQSYGDIDIENITVDFPISDAYNSATKAAIVTSGGDLTINGATVSVAYSNKLQRVFYVAEDANGNGGNIVIKNGATVTNTKNSNISSGKITDGVIWTSGNMTVYSDCTVSFTAYDRLLSSLPAVIGYCTHTNVTESNLATVTDFAVTPAPCPHENTTDYEYVAPNCTDSGNIAYSYCNDCFVYLDSEGNLLDEGDWVLDPQGEHVKGENWVKDQSTVVNATCNSTGYYEIVNMCTKCGKHEFERVPVVVPVNDEGHVWVEVDGTRVEPTAQAFGSATFKCDKCDEEKIDRIAAKFYGTNVDLGNSLDMNFYFRCDLDGVDYSKAYAIIVRHYANGLTKEEKVMLTDCGEPSGKYYIIKYTGIAAKEMNDLVEVTVYDGNNVAISETKSESIKTYAMRVLEKYTADSDANAKIRTLIADMLNYGAAMQTYFSYDVENLASAGVDICAERANATAAEFTNNQSSSNNSYYGASFTMKSDISMNLYVLAESIDAGGKAVITYKNFRGVDQAFEITESKLVGRYYVFNMDALIVADARQDINIKFYDASGNLVVDVTESMECYLARWAASGTTGSEHADEVIKFTDSATAYLTK